MKKAISMGTIGKLVSAMLLVSMASSALADESSANVKGGDMKR